MRARYYDQDIRRFINRDVVSGEITNSGSLNRYCYVQGNPVSLTDPFGLCPDSNSAFKNLCINLYYLDWNALGHVALDTAGIFFEGADVLNVIWYACEGNMEMAAASAVCAIPGLGFAAGGLLMKGNKLAAAGKAVKAIAKLTQGTMGVCAGIEMARTGFTNLLNGLEAGTLDGGALLQTLGGIGIAVLSGKGMVSSGRDLLVAIGNSGKTVKGRLLDTDVSGKSVESGGMATYTTDYLSNGNSSTGLFLPDVYYQKMDDNFAKAVAARDAEIARIQSLSTSQQRKVTTVVGGVDIRTGEIFVGVKESSKYGRLAVCAEDIVFRGLGGNTNANIIMKT